MLWRVKCLDGTFMSVAKLRDFIQKTIDEANEKGVIWSIHLKATMMKISDPIHVPVMR